MADVRGAVQTVVASSAVAGLGYYLNQPKYPVTESDIVVLGLSCKHIYVWFGNAVQDIQTKEPLDEGGQRRSLQPYLYTEFTGEEQFEWPTIFPRPRHGGEESDPFFFGNEQIKAPNSNSRQIGSQGDGAFKLVVDGKTRLLSVTRDGYRHENILTAAVFHHLKKLGDTELVASLSEFQRSVFVVVHLSKKNPAEAEALNQRADGVCHLIFTSNAVARLFRNGEVLNMQKLSIAKVSKHVHEDIENYIGDMVPLEAPYNLYKRYRYFSPMDSSEKKFAIRAYPHCFFKPDYNVSALKQHVELGVYESPVGVLGTLLGAQETEDFIGFWFYAFQTQLHIRFILENTYKAKFTSNNPNVFSLLYSTSMRPLLIEMIMQKSFVFNAGEAVTSVVFDTSEPNNTMIFDRNPRFGFTLEMYIKYPSLILVEQFIKGSNQTPQTFSKVKVKGVFVLSQEQGSAGSTKTVYNFDTEKIIVISWFSQTNP